jgi:hypothetical protein
MPTTDDPREISRVADPTFEVDLHTAEALLFELACRLRCVPLDEHTRAIHLAALASKHGVALWSSEPPPAEVRRTSIDELVHLHEEAKMWARVERGSGP